MKNSRIFIIVLCCVIITILIGCTTQKATISQKEKTTVRLFADYPYYSSIDSLTKKAKIIIEGTILNSRMEEIDIGTKTGKEDGKKPSTKFMYTVYTVKVNNSYKGNVEPGETIEVKQIGGESETTVYIAEETVEFAKDKKYIMFLSTYESKVPPSLLNPIQGAYCYEEEAAKSNKGKLISTNPKNDLSLTIGDLERIKNENKK